MAYAQMIGGAAFGAINAYQQNRSSQDEAKFNSRLARYNAQIARNHAIEQRDLEAHNAALRRRDAVLAEINAGVSLATAMATEDDVRRDVKRYRSALRAGAGASGIRVDTGSALEADLEAARLGEYHALKAGFSARMASFAHKEDAKLLVNEAEFHESRSKYLTEHGIEAAGELLDVSAKYYRQWAEYYDRPATVIGQVVLGAAAGALGTDYKLPQPSKSPKTDYDPMRTSQPDYQSYREGERADYSDRRGGGDSDYTSDYDRPGISETSSDAFNLGSSGAIQAWGYL